MSLIGLVQECEKSGCRQSAEGFVCVGLDCGDGRVLVKPYGWRCEEHGREGQLHHEFDEEARKKYIEAYTRQLVVPNGARLFIGMTRLSPEDVAELLQTAEAPAASRTVHGLPVDRVPFSQ
jgi:hypothetical protein